MPQAARIAVSDDVWPPRLQTHYLIGVLLICSVLSSIDSQILGLMVVHVKRDFALSDTEFSFLLGLAFSLFAATCGIPIARLADSRSRRIVISVGLTVWCSMTAFCGIAQNYWQLFAARLGIGAGESSLHPSAHSMISDSFPRAALPVAIAIFAMGTQVGRGFSLFVGSKVIDYVATLPNPSLPIVGEIYSWQMAFFVVGIPGFLMVPLILLTVKEPLRKGMMRVNRQGGATAMKLGDVARLWLQNWRSFLPLHLGVAFKALLGSGTSVWMPAFFIRTYGWSLTQMGAWYGGLTMLLGPLGMIYGGYLSKWLDNKGYTDANPRSILINSVILIPFAIFFPLMPSPQWALVLIAGRVFFGATSIGPSGAAIQVISPNQARAQFAAFHFFLLSFVGTALGPTCVALITDYYFQNEAALNLSMSVLAVFLGPLASLLLYLTLKPYRQSVERAREWM